MTVPESAGCGEDAEAGAGVMEVDDGAVRGGGEIAHRFFRAFRRRERERVSDRAVGREAEDLDGFVRELARLDLARDVRAEGDAARRERIEQREPQDGRGKRVAFLPAKFAGCGI